MTDTQGQSWCDSFKNPYCPLTTSAISLIEQFYIFEDTFHLQIRLFQLIIYTVSIIQELFMSYGYICLRQNAISKLFVDLAVNDCQPSLRGLSTTTTTSSKISPIWLSNPCSNSNETRCFSSDWYSQ